MSTCLSVPSGLSQDNKTLIWQVGAGEMISLWEMALLSTGDVTALFVRAEGDLQPWLLLRHAELSTLVGNVVVRTLSTLKELIAEPTRDVLARELGFLTVTPGVKFRGCKRKWCCLLFAKVSVLVAVR